jgi:hypothetical protein
VRLIHRRFRVVAAVGDALWLRYLAFAKREY